MASMETELWRWKGGAEHWDTTRGVSVAPNGSCTLEDWPSSTTIFDLLLSQRRLTENDKSQGVSFPDQGLAFPGGDRKDAKRALRSGDVRNAYSADATRYANMVNNMGWQDDLAIADGDDEENDLLFGYLSPSPTTETAGVEYALSSTVTPMCLHATTTPARQTQALIRPTLTSRDDMRTATPVQPSFGASEFRTAIPAQPSFDASAYIASKSANYFSPQTIGIVTLAAILAFVCAGVLGVWKYQAKKNGDETHGGDVLAVLADQTSPATTNYATPSACDPSERSGTNDVLQAVLEAAHNLAQNSQFPGVAEAATLVKTLATLVSNDRRRIAEAEAKLKRCRLLVAMLERAATVLGKINNVEDTESSMEMKRMLMDNVQDAIGDMVGLIKTYNSKRRITQVVVSTLFKRRMEETEAVINQTFSDLMTWLHVDIAMNQGDRTSVADRRRKASGVRGRLKMTNQNAIVGPRLRKPITEAESIVSERRLRRQRNLNQIEIPADHVIISEDVLGKGGFGTVYAADYNGRNAAAKVILVEPDDGYLSGECDADVEAEIEKGNKEEKRQRAALLLELQAMMRLRSPHTVNVYGAITSTKGKLILVMELLTGGDLRSLLKHSTERIPEPQARRIIQDVCAGMAFLHSKCAVHGDIKSANVLLDGEGRAKIGDFGTSRWAQHSDSTGLATYTCKQGSTSHNMSFGWAAPEVLNAGGISSASDVYSFGVVAWEVLSMETPWADEALPFDIYTRVVFKGDRPEIPAHAPVDITSVLRACWATEPEERPASAEILAILKARLAMYEALARTLDVLDLEG